MTEEKKGITVKIDAELHAEVREYIESHGMTMAEFVSQALYNELHPKFQPQEVKNMGPTRTMAFQMPEEMFQRLKDYLHRHNITQKQFVLGLVEAELSRDQELRNIQDTETAKSALTEEQTVEHEPEEDPDEEMDSEETAAEAAQEEEFDEVSDFEEPEDEESEDESFGGTDDDLIEDMEEEPEAVFSMQ